jgi:hypothetical protein
MSTQNVTELFPGLEGLVRSLLPKLIAGLEQWQETEKLKIKMATVAEEQRLWDSIVQLHLSFGVGSLSSMPGGKVEDRIPSAIASADRVIQARRATFKE